MANKPEQVAVKIIGAALGNDVDYSSGRAPEFRRIRICCYLVFLHCLLANGQTRRVDRIVSEVGAIYLHERRAAALSADIQAGSRSRADGPAIIASYGRDG